MMKVTMITILVTMLIRTQCEKHNVRDREREGEREKEGGEERERERGRRTREREERERERDITERSARAAWVRVPYCVRQTGERLYQPSDSSAARILSKGPG